MTYVLFGTVFGTRNAFYEDRNIMFTVISQVLIILSILAKSYDIYLISAIRWNGFFLTYPYWEVQNPSAKIVIKTYL